MAYYCNLIGYSGLVWERCSRVERGTGFSRDPVLGIIADLPHQGLKARLGTVGQNPFGLKKLHQRGRPGQTATPGSVVHVMIELLGDHKLVDLGRGEILCQLGLPMIGSSGRDREGLANQSDRTYEATATKKNMVR
jgi:hypothetical protein